MLSWQKVVGATKTLRKCYERKSQTLLLEISVKEMSSGERK